MFVEFYSVSAKIGEKWDILLYHTLYFDEKYIAIAVYLETRRRRSFWTRFDHPWCRSIIRWEHKLTFLPTTFLFVRLWYHCAVIILDMILCLHAYIVYDSLLFFITDWSSSKSECVSCFSLDVSMCAIRWIVFLSFDWCHHYSVLQFMRDYFVQVTILLVLSILTFKDDLSLMLSSWTSRSAL